MKPTKWVRPAKPCELPEFTNLTVDQEWNDSSLNAIILTDKVNGACMKLQLANYCINVYVPEPPKKKKVLRVTGKAVAGSAEFPVEKDFDEFEKAAAERAASDLVDGKVEEMEVLA